ncbi:unnamed protein product [Ceutorhynchus assimilis]|uniref:Uncharacterized protein n=1 Tax=Ceutorhynchus assimilis TaxID=467358 RepID=A0A9N9MGZ5_9CUCU|nr:unnamed protein product [Ceutorhynchus assimilis]
MNSINDSIKEILKNFELSELLDSFEANDIDLEAMTSHPDLIKEIIPSVGKRLKFIAKYNKYITEIIIPETQKSTSPSPVTPVIVNEIQIQSPSSASTTTVEKLEEYLESLEKYLDDNTEGKLLLLSHELLSPHNKEVDEIDHRIFDEKVQRKDAIDESDGVESDNNTEQ